MMANELDKLVVEITPRLNMSVLFSQLIDLRDILNQLLVDLTVENPSFEGGEGDEGVHQDSDHLQAGREGEDYPR
jgi:hypothetical protein